MGTRSLLAVETKRGTLHIQYMQFDGYPSVKGYEYYSAVLFAMLEAGAGNFITKQGKPNQRFRDRCIHFLNDYQYKTHHSTGNNWEGKKSKDWNFQKDCWQEFEYLFDINGDFIIDGHGLHYEIPWAVTKGIAQGFMSRHDLNLDKSCYDDDAVNIISQLFKQLEDDAEPLTMEVESGEVFAFPDQKKNGWRNYAIIRLLAGDKLALKIQDSMATKSTKKRKVVHSKTVGEKDLETA